MWNDWGGPATAAAAPAVAEVAQNSNGQGEEGTQIPWYFRPYKWDRSFSREGDLVTWPKPYQPPSEGSSSTAQTSDTTTATTTVTGQVINTGTNTTVNSNFTTSTTFNDSATMSAASPAGFSLSQPGAAGSLHRPPPWWTHVPAAWSATMREA